MTLTSAQTQRLLDEYGAEKAMNILICLLDMPKDCIRTAMEVENMKLKRDNCFLKRGVRELEESLMSYASMACTKKCCCNR